MAADTVSLFLFFLFRYDSGTVPGRAVAVRNIAVDQNGLSRTDFTTFLINLIHSDPLRRDSDFNFSFIIQRHRHLHKKFSMHGYAFISCEKATAHRNIYLHSNLHLHSTEEFTMARSQEMDLTKGNPFGSLLRFCIPVILGNLFQLFYTLADSVIVGKTLGANALAAVGSTSIIIYFVLCFINGFGICLGQRCGAKDERGMRQSIAVSTLLCIAFTILLTLICTLLSRQILVWMQVQDDIFQDAWTYMFIVLLGTGATIFYNMISMI